MKVALSRVHFPLTTLGPGRRLGIWFQGCSIRCNGCISADTWAHGRLAVEVESLLEELRPWLAECDGVTVSGGEPFDQPEALFELLKEVRARNSPDVLVYSGYAFERIAEHPAVMSSLIDALISDPFVLDAPQTKALRGSDNQRLHCLTPRGSSVFGSFERAVSDAEKRLDGMFDEGGTVWLAGIPRKGDMRRLQLLLAEQGHQAHTSEARS
jgi:anaerobic ribonucleoside-triphosphate reductase activating protein